MNSVIVVDAKTNTTGLKCIEVKNEGMSSKEKDTLNKMHILSVSTFKCLHLWQQYEVSFLLFG